MSSFSVSFKHVGPVCVLSLTGELDAHTAPEFDAALQSRIDAGDAQLVADGAGLEYVSSAGLGVFMAYVEPTRDLGGELKIAALPARVAEVFDLLGFHEVFDIAATVDDAVARFGATPAAEA